MIEKCAARTVVLPEPLLPEPSPTPPVAGTEAVRIGPGPGSSGPTHALREGPATAWQGGSA